MRRCGNSCVRWTPRPGGGGARDECRGGPEARVAAGRRPRQAGSGRMAARPEGGSGTMTAMRGLSALILALSLVAGANPGTDATLEVANRKVFTFRVTGAGSSPDERLATARARLE